jgi:D-sedoheptulose 7-phosphate isomerase
MGRIDTYLREVAAALEIVSSESVAAIEQALWETYQRDGTIFVCGNGGSAASASHFACDLAKWTVTTGRRRLRALALTDNVPIMTAWSNDTAYERVFVEQLITFYRPGDTLVAISGSGNSPNILCAVEWANAQGATTIGISGFDGGRLASLASIALVVPNNVMPQIEDIHMTLCHGIAVSIGEQMQRQ